MNVYVCCGSRCDFSWVWGFLATNGGLSESNIMIVSGSSSSIVVGIVAVGASWALVTEIVWDILLSAPRCPVSGVRYGRFSYQDTIDRLYR
jgi:hypothetical protein